MSYDNFWNDHHLAGPRHSAVLRLPRNTSDPSSTTAGSNSPQSHPELPFLHSTQKSRGRDAGHPNFRIRPHFLSPLGDGDAAADMAMYLDPRFRYIAYGGNYTSPSDTIMSHDCSGHLEKRDAAFSRDRAPCDTEHTDSNDSKDTMSDSLSSSHSQIQTFPSSQTSQLSSPRNVDENPEIDVLGSKLDGSDDLPHLLPARFSKATSPYAPMPLPPIFALDSPYKVMHTPIDTASSSPAPFWPARCEKDIQIDPALSSDASHREPVSASYPRTPFARGGTATESLWSPPPSDNPPVSVGRKLSLPNIEDSINISLESAETQADEFRAISLETQLSVDFLMKFMGKSKPTGKSAWQCYIQDCGKQLTRKGHMVDHIRMHLGEKVFFCESCPRAFLRKADCKRHTAAHNPDKPFQCDSCAKSFGRKDLLMRHIRSCQLKENDDGHINGKYKGKKRKGMNESSNLKTRSTQNTSSFATQYILFPGFKSDSDFVPAGFDEAEKENIPPSSVPSGPMFNQASTTGVGGSGLGEGRRSKKARTRL